MAILKVIEIMSSSNKSWEDATQNAVAEAIKTLKGIVSMYVQDMSATVNDNKVDEYRDKVKLPFKWKR